MKTHCKTPCKDCPFLKNTKIVLENKRAKEISKTDAFTCHKTLHKPKQKQCAGFMLFAKYQSIYVRLATLMQIDLGLSLAKGQSVMNEKEFLTHHNI
jgi:hypothetical protein